MRVLVEGSGGAAGWPQPGCRCASCLRMSGNPRARSTILIDDVLRVGAGDDEIPEIEGYRILRVSRGVGGDGTGWGAVVVWGGAGGGGGGV